MPQPVVIPVPPCVPYPLVRTPEDEVSARKEAMIQAELMNKHLKDALDLNEVLKTHTQVSVIVSATFFYLLSVGCFSLGFAT